MHAPPDDLSRLAADVLGRIRARRPRVHCITNAVAQTYTPNLLLAAGAIPSMTIAAREVAAFAGRADALLINLGTLDAEREAAAFAAIQAVAAAGRPWVLDPVFIDRSPPRAELARRLADQQPAAIRLNAAEFVALAGEQGDDAVTTYAARHRTVIAMTGETDRISDGARTASVSNGHPLMARVTAMGCAGSALLAACLAVETDAWVASCASLILLGVAGEIAATRARGPGSFAIEILDALDALDRDAIVAHAKVTR